MSNIKPLDEDFKGVIYQKFCSSRDFISRLSELLFLNGTILDKKFQEEKNNFFEFLSENTNFLDIDKLTEHYKHLQENQKHTMDENLKKGEKITISNFGTFEVSETIFA